MSENSNLPAFPVELTNDDNIHVEGLSKREWFAGMAMQGLMANEQNAPVTDYEYAAKACIKMADALLAELDKPLQS